MSREYEDRITWGDNIKVPELAGTWIEVKYDHGYTFDFKLNSETKHGITNKLISTLHDTFVAYWSLWDWGAPFMIDVKDDGQFVLVCCRDRNNNVTHYNKIMKSGNLTFVKKGYGS